MSYRIKMIGGVGNHDLGTRDDKGEPMYLKAGEIAVVEKPFHTMFPDKFILLSAGDLLSGGEIPPVTPPKAVTDESSIDVTSRFPSAEAAGLTVRSKDGAFSLWKGDDLVIDGLATEALVVTEIDDAASN